MGTDIKRDVTSDKEMENKYYTPSIEEFHVGFELELLTHSGWERATIEDGDEYYDIVLAPGGEGVDNKRVKYLDREDIESLGWKLVEEYARNDAYYFSFKKKHTELVLYPGFEETTVLIQHGSATGINSKGYPIFRGQLKNKSELKRLLKQLGI
tara:strand:- start:358 stop:819 length:462 start_codon:yes stop_codon:yes gene_type:complete